MKRRLLAFLALLLFTGPAGAFLEAADWFSRYHRDEAVSRILLQQRRLGGRLENGRLYLTEAEAIEMALVNNLEINVQRHAALKSQWEISRNNDYYDPRTSFGFNWDRQTNPTASVLQGGTKVTDILTNYNFGYEQAFRRGTSLEAGFLGNRNKTTNFFSSLIPAIRTEFHFLVRQDLLQGFGKADAEYQLEISQNNLDVTAEQFRVAVTDVIVQVQDRFWELEASWKDMDVRQKSLEFAETVLEQNKARFEIGTASRLEVVEAEAEVAARREELIRSQYTHRRIQDVLVRLITDFEDPRTFQGEIVPVVSGSELQREDLPFDALLSMAEEYRPEIQQADLEIANLRVNLDRSRDQLKPSLQAVVGYQWFGLGGTEIVRDFSQGFLDAPVVAIREGGLGDSLGQLLSGDYGGYVLGLNLQIPFANTGARADNAMAQIDLRRVELQRQATRQAVALEIRDALTQVEMNKARLEASRATVSAAGERLAGEEARFEVGMGTTRELIEAQRDLLAAQSTEVRARMDLVKSFSLLDKAAGRTFERNNIVLSETLQKNVYTPR